MKRILILLLISLSTVIVSFSQTTYPKILNDSLVVITNQQLKETNLIFAEHKKLKAENIELNTQIKNYQSLVDNYQKTEALNELKVTEYKNYADMAHEKLLIQDKELKSIKSKQKVLKWVSIGGVTLSATLAILLIFK